MIDGQFIGVDVGGTKIAVAAMERGELGENRLLATDTSSSDALIEQLCSMIEDVRGPDACAVGIGVPSVVEFATGRIRFSVNIPLADLPLRSLLSDRIGLPVYVENDASCAALAEAYEGEELTASDLVMFTVGTGVGGGLVLGGRLYRGKTGAAPEIGHMMIGLALTEDVPEPAAKPPQPGSLESLASGRALDGLAEHYARRHPHSTLGRILVDRGRVAGRDAVEAAHDGDAAALEVLQLLGRRLGVGIANAINIFDPAEVVIGGGVSTAGELLLEPAREVAKGFILPGVGTETTIRLARRGPEAGVAGAALIAVQEFTEEHRPTQPPPVEDAAA